MDRRNISRKNHQRRPPRPSSLAILQNLYGGRGGKVTLAMTYQYQMAVVRHRDPQLARIFERLCWMEQQHVSRLGEMIATLGGTPSYQNAGGQYWSGGYVACQKKTCPMVLEDLRREVDMMEALLAAANSIHDRHISRQLQRMAEDAALHIRVLKEVIRLRRCAGEKLCPC